MQIYQLGVALPAIGRGVDAVAEDLQQRETRSMIADALKPIRSANAHLTRPAYSSKGTAARC